MPTKTKRKPLTAAQDPAKQTNLWKLLRIGLRDLRKHERTRGCVVDMRRWLESNGECRACLAGAVMRHSLNMRSLDTISPDWADALNDLRSGDVSFANDWMPKSSENHAKALRLDRDMPKYEEDREAWWKEMRKLLADLKSADI